jgi:two-component system, NarL family, invasion response regulator UvrY
VLGMIGSGKSMTLIATDLSLSIKTVSTYRTRLLERMGMKSTAQLIKYAVQHQLER